MGITSIQDPWEGQPRRDIESIIKNEIGKLKGADAQLQGAIDLLGGGSVASPSEYVRAMLGGVKIAFHRKYVQGVASDNAPLAVSIDQWAQYARWGNRADGVLVLVDGGQPILVGLEQACIPWSAIDYLNCGESTGLPLIASRASISKDLDGKQRSALILSNELQNCGNAAFENYSAGWCSVYSSPGVGAGKWWLPSIGELMVLWSHVDEINIAIDVINSNLNSGEPQAMKIGKQYYQSSSEYSRIHIWAMEMMNGFSFPAAKNGQANAYTLPISSIDAFMAELDVASATRMALPGIQESPGVVEA